MNLIDQLLDSWDRQSRIVNAVATRVNDANRKSLPSSDGWPLDVHLAHIHKVRHSFLSNVAPEAAAGIADSFVDGWETPIEDLEQIQALLQQSSDAVRQVTKAALEAGVEQFGWYDNPVLFLQHMVWHEGWHVGLIFLGLRLAGQEPEQEWEETTVWGEWRTEEY